MLKRDLGRLVGSANGMPLYAPFCGSQRQAGRLVGYKGQQVLMPPGCPQFSGMTLGKQVGYANGMPLYFPSVCCEAGAASGSFSGSGSAVSGSFSSGGVTPVVLGCGPIINNTDFSADIPFPNTLTMVTVTGGPFQGNCTCFAPKTISLAWGASYLGVASQALPGGWLGSVSALCKGSMLTLYILLYVSTFPAVPNCQWAMDTYCGSFTHAALQNGGDSFPVQTLQSSPFELQGTVLVSGGNPPTCCVNSQDSFAFTITE